MASEKATAVSTAAYAKWHSDDLEDMRAGFDGMMGDPAPEVSITDGELGGIRGRWVITPRSGERVVLYVHGGGFMLGSSQAYRAMGSWIADATGSRVFLVDYRRAPEHPFPAAHEDVLAAYRGLIADGVTANDVVVGGDSAGGGIALSVLVALRDAGDPLPAAAFLMSPFADLTLASESITSLASTDPLASPEAAQTMSLAYLGGADPSDVRASPLLADFAGLPPLLVQVASCEILLDDAVRVVERARGAGVPAELQAAFGMVHVFQMFRDDLPEAAAAYEAIGDFVARHVGAPVLNA